MLPDQQIALVDCAKITKKLRFCQYCCLVGQIYMYFYLLVDFNYSLDSV